MIAWTVLTICTPWNRRLNTVVLDRAIGGIGRSEIIVLRKIEREVQGPQKMLEACRSPNTMSAVSPGNGDDAGSLLPHCPTCWTADGTIRTDRFRHSNKACPHYSESTKHVAINSLKRP